MLKLTFITDENRLCLVKIITMVSSTNKRNVSLPSYTYAALFELAAYDYD